MLLNAVFFPQRFRTIRVPVLVLALCGSLPGALRADVVALQDGSRLVGTVVRMDDKVLVIETAFAGRLEIGREAIAGVETEADMVVSLPDGSRLVGRLRHDAQTPQAVDTRLTGRLPVPPAQIASAWRPADPSPEQQALAQAEQAHAEEVAALKDAQRSAAEVWSGKFEMGVAGASGNTRKQDASGKIAARRETDFDRLMLSLSGRSASQDGSQTEAEVIARAGLERDFTDRWFTFGESVFERDKFEDVDLRATLSAGVGYFVIKEKDHIWKPRIGVGYQYEALRTDPDEGEFIVSMGYEYWIRMFDRLKVSHDFRYLPSLEQPGSDYRLESELGVELPLSEKKDWTVGFSLRHQYDAMPPDDVRNLDTFYQFNLGYRFD